MYIFVLSWLSLVFAAAVPVTDLIASNSYSSPTSARSIVYVQNFKTTSGDQLSLLPLIRQPTNITHVFLAAVHVNQDPGDIKLNDSPHNDTVFDAIWSEAAQLQQSGVKIVMMLGGFAQGSFQRLCSGNPINDNYYVPLREALEYHKVDGVDLDIEEEVDISCPLALLRRFDKDFGSNFILTMAPVASELSPAEVGLSGLSYSALDTQATSLTRPNGKLVNWYNAQFYNGWGDPGLPSGYTTIIEHGYSPDRVVMGVLVNPTDRGGGSEESSGWYPIHTYKDTIRVLKANHTNFGGIFGWEYWDAGARDNYTEPWQWVQEIGTAIFGPDDAPSYSMTKPISDGRSPWPNATHRLERMGIVHLEAVRALNVTSGNFGAAVSLLGMRNASLSDRM